MADESLLSMFSPRVLLASFIIVITLAIIAAAITVPATLAAYNPSWDGTSTTRATIASMTGSPPAVVDTAAYDSAQANDTLAVILAPRETYNTDEVRQLEGFLNRGGTILVAEDRRTETNKLLRNLSVQARIGGQPLRDPRQYHRNPAAPVITDIATNSTISGVEQFTLNRGSVLRSADETAVAKSSEFAYVDQNGNRRLDRNEQLRSYPVLSSEQVSNGRVLVLSDPSVFINQMIERDGNQALLEKLAASHSHIILDYSHTPGTTPLINLWLWVYRTAWAQAGIAVLAGLVVVGWTYDPARKEVHATMRRVQNRVNQHPNTDRIHLTAEERTTFLQNRYPDWDPDRIQRIVENMQERKDQFPADEQSLQDTDE